MFICIIFYVFDYVFAKSEEVNVVNNAQINTSIDENLENNIETVETVNNIIVHISRLCCERRNNNVSRRF